MPDRRRARVAEYAERVNRALDLLRRLPPAAVLRTLAHRYHLSPRQARRYVEAAQEHPEGVPVPEATVVCAVKLPVSLARRLRALARNTGESLSALVTRGLDDWLHRARPRIEHDYVFDPLGDERLIQGYRLLPSEQRHTVRPARPRGGADPIGGTSREDRRDLRSGFVGPTEGGADGRQSDHRPARVRGGRARLPGS